MRIFIYVVTIIIVIVIVFLQMSSQRTCHYPFGQEKAGRKVGAIIAFAFGNRRTEYGEIIPGPVNVSLANITEILYQQTASPVYAQWEISESIASVALRAKVHGIYPEKNADGEVYLSTMGVVDKVITLAGTNESLGPVLVVAHRDHLCRCIQYLRKRGFDAYAPSLALPSKYDVQSDQTWTRSAVVYRIADSIASLGEKLTTQ